MIVVPGLPPVRSGPYRLLRHPNYVAVVVEGVALPLVHAAWVTALVFTVAQRRAADRADPGRERRAAHAAAAGLVRCVTWWSPAAGRSAWPPRCTPPAPASTSSCASRATAPIDKACGEGLMPGGGRRPRRPRRGPDGPADRRHPLRRRAARAVDAPFRAGPGRGVRRTALHAALSAAVADGRRRRRAPARCATVEDARRPRARRRRAGPATWSPPTACTRRCAGCSGWTRRPAAARRYGLRAHVAVRAVVGVRRGALVAARARPT